MKALIQHTSFIVVMLIATLQKTIARNSSYTPNYITDEELELAKTAQVLSEKVSNSSNTSLKVPGNSSTNSLIRPGFKFTLWPRARVPYKIDPAFTSTDRLQIASAIKSFHDNTCLRFIPKTFKHHDYLEIVLNPSICSLTEVCIVGGRQVAEIGGSCIDTGDIIKALGHTICMSKEQTRRDRDKWIAFNPAVCPTPEIDEWCFFKGLDKLYDYLSVEHDEINDCYNGCFLPKQPNIARCGSGGALSVLDIEAINEVYNCKSGCLGYRFVNIDNPSIRDLFPGGNYFDGTILYSCRAYHNGDIIPGWYNENTKQCFVPWGGDANLKTEDVEVFTTPNGGNYQWISSGSIPANAVRGGRSNLRETLYVIRCLYTVNGVSTWIPGKLHPSAGYFIAYDGVEIECGGSIIYEYLVCVS